MSERENSPEHPGHFQNVQDISENVQTRTLNNYPNKNYPNKGMAPVRKQARQEPDSSEDEKQVKVESDNRHYIETTYEREFGNLQGRVQAQSVEIQSLKTEVQTLRSWFDQLEAQLQALENQRPIVVQQGTFRFDN